MAQKLTPKSREAYAAQRAVDDLKAALKGTYAGDPDQALRDVVFNLARAYHAARVERAAASIVEEGRAQYADLGSVDVDPDTVEESTEEAIRTETERLAIYTADNLVALLGTENDDAAWDAMGGDALAPPSPGQVLNSLSSVAERLAYYATEADLRAALDRLAPDPNAPKVA